MGFAWLTVLFFIRWYRPIAAAWTVRAHRIALACLPVFSFAIILYTLRVLASFDVVGDGFYIIFYLLFGFAWQYGGMLFITRCFDISWQDDALLAGNRAALYAVSGVFLGLTCIFAGANVGDGPGWWCVVFAGGLGFTVWVVLAYVFHLLADVFERVTVDRDTGCGIRFGCYLLASGLILGRASAGDWTSAAATVREFADGWPVLPLVILALIVERGGLYRAEQRRKLFRNAPAYNRGVHITGSIVWGTALVAAAVCAILLLPGPKENPVYHNPQEVYETIDSDRWAL